MPEALATTLGVIIGLAAAYGVVAAIRKAIAWRRERLRDREARRRVTVATQALVDIGCDVTHLVQAGRIVGIVVRRGNDHFVAKFSTVEACAFAVNTIRDRLLGLVSHEEVL